MWQSRPAQTALSNSVVVIDLYLSVSIFGPTLSPPPLSRPAGRKRGASFGHVFEALQCFALASWAHVANRTLWMSVIARSSNLVLSVSNFVLTCLSSLYFLCLYTRPNMVVSSLLIIGVRHQFRCGALRHPIPGEPKARRIWALTPKTRAGGESGAKNEKNTNPSTTTEPFAGQEYASVDCRAAPAMTSRGDCHALACPEPVEGLAMTTY